jgi:hypothetical protein
MEQERDPEGTPRRQAREPDCLLAGRAVTKGGAIAEKADGEIFFRNARLQDFRVAPHQKYGITAGAGAGARPNVWHAEIAVLECESTKSQTATRKRNPWSAS